MKHLTPDPALFDQDRFHVKELTDLKLKLARYAFQIGLCGHNFAAAHLSDAIDQIEAAQDSIAHNGRKPEAAK